MQRIMLATGALSFLHGAWTLLGSWPPDDVMPFLLLFVLPTALVAFVLRKGLPAESRGEGA